MAPATTNEEGSEMRRLLVVDDEEIVLVALRETLMRAGYEVTATNDAGEALDSLRNGRYAVIITDQQMPRMTGLEFLAQAKEIRPEATRILITAVLNLGTVIEAINKGEIYRFIVKPWLREEFLGAVESAVERYRLVAGNDRLRLQLEAAQGEVRELNRRLEAAGEELESKSRQLEALRREWAATEDRNARFVESLLERVHPGRGRRTMRVVALSRLVGDAAGLGQVERRALERASLLHDLGLIQVPQSVVEMATTGSTLTEEQRSAWEKHPTTGAEMAEVLQPDLLVRGAIESHHEHWDGGGFPRGSSGASIPWLGRLLAAVIAYVDGREDGDLALERVRSLSGTELDPAAVESLVRGLSPAGQLRSRREVRLSELRPGMVLTKGIYTSGGSLLVPGERALSAEHIDALRNHEGESVLPHALEVYG